jgi:hypothetical protein
MLKTIFIGAKNDFDDMLVHWLSKRTEVVGAVWLDPGAWRSSWSGRLDFLKKRIRRRGVLKALDEAAYFFVFNALLEGGNAEQLYTLSDPYFAANDNARWTGDSITAESVNAPEVLEFVAERQPDLAFAMCINNYFGRKIRAIPRHGVFLWHEGVTPDYRGLHSPFWALHNGDFDSVGYTLLRMNDELDGGEIYVQGRLTGFDPHRDTPSYLGHKAIVESLPAVERFLGQLGAGTATPIERSGAASSYYSYPGLTDLVRLRLRLRRYVPARAAPAAVVAGANERAASPAAAKPAGELLANE